MPGSTTMSTVGPNTPLTIDIQTPEIMDLSIKYLDLKPVTNPISFERDKIPTYDGLFSENIFGTTLEERKHQYGYINLNCKILHPFIYRRLRDSQLNIENCCAGEGCWKVTDDGDLIRLKDNDPDANPKNTGMDWFIANLPKIKLKRNKSRGRNERLDVLETFSVDEMVIDKWIVMPVFYRDVSGNKGTMQMPEIDKQYVKLIRYANSLKTDAVYFLGNLTKFNIQKTVNGIHDYFIHLIEKSDGFFHQYVIGKNPDYGCRSVISCQTLDQYDFPDEVPVDPNHCGLPLADVCTTLFPFIIRWVTNFLTEEFENNGNKIPVYYNGQFIFAELVNPMDDYNVDAITKRINKFIDNYETRFEPVLVQCRIDEEVVKLPLGFAGRPYYPRNPNKIIEGISERYMTWTDLLYIAAVECSATKHTWVTRYPIKSYTGIFPCKIHVLSTVDIQPMKLVIYGEEKEYPYYPKVDPNARHEDIETAFNDTVNMDNSFLDSIGGDYDGDQISHRAVFSVESNEETENIMNSKKFYLTCQGRLVKNLAETEPVLCLFSLTRTEPKKAKPASPEAVAEILSTNYKDIGCKKLTQWFGYTTDIKTKKIKPPKFNVYDTVKLAPKQYTNTEAVETTLGMLAFNKVCIEPYIVKIIDGGYWNKPLNKNMLDELQTIAATALKNDKITVDELWPWIKAVEFYAYKCTTIFSGSTTRLTITPQKDIVKKRDEFFKENPNPTIAQVSALEDELSAMLKEKVDADTSRTLFESKAKAKTDDQLKMMNTMIGPVYNPTNGQFDVVPYSFMEGFRKEDIPKAGNMVVIASYSKSVGTSESGYITKQFYSMYGGVQVDKDGTDCGTKSYLNLEYNEENWKSLEGQYVSIDGNKFEPVTDTNYKKYINRPIKVRSAMCCLGEKVCSVCAGRRPYEMDMDSIGITFATVPNVFLNAGMKKFHVSKIKLTGVNPNTLFI